MIADPSTNTFQVDANSSILVDINTESAPTVTPNGIQAGVFEINVTFSEEVSNVDIGDFRFVLKDQDTASTTFGLLMIQTQVQQQTLLILSTKRISAICKLKIVYTNIIYRLSK